MHRLVSKLVVYRNMEEGGILRKLAAVTERLEVSDGRGDETGELRVEALGAVNLLLDVATRYGFDGNLWHNYLALILATTETPFTLVAEKTGAVEGSVNILVKEDLRIFRRLFDYDLTALDESLGIDCFGLLTDYRAVVKSEQIFNRSVSEKVRALSDVFGRAESDDELYKAVTDFYRDYGVGMLGLNKAFRIAENDALRHPKSAVISAEQNPGLLVPITNTADISFDDLVGYEEQKKQLMSNTEAFLSGRPANNVLLYGSAGTGKSSSIKALLNRYYKDGLRMIEVYRHQTRLLPKIVEMIRNRNYKFILYMDDLSFEDFETDYKYLKAVIEGGLEPYPDNVLIYATSNRRHLIRETVGDRQDDRYAGTSGGSEKPSADLHINDTMSEKLSLAARFGLQIGYFAPTPSDYDEIVLELARRHPEIELSEDELIKKARAWEIRHGGFSGRAAQQFINHLLGSGE